MPETPSPPVLAVLDASGAPVLLDVATPLLRADDLGVLRGESVFETMRAYGGCAFRLDEHLDRMTGSAAVVAVTLPPRNALQALAARALEAFGPGDGSLRLVVTKGADSVGAGTAFALASPVSATSEEARRSGVRAVTLTLGVPATLRREAPWLLGGVKSTSYATAMASLRTAAERDAGDAIYLSSDGEVLEAPTSSVVAVLDGETVTPPEGEVGILAGTTVGFFGGVRGVVAALDIDGHAVGTGAVGPHGRAMRDRYEAAVHALGATR
jgi:4-amino-4-deoxychorismate lyase